MEEFKDKRGRTWETFLDISYFDCTCVRLKGERRFDSHLAFHFATSGQAKEFIKLLKEAY